MLRTELTERLGIELPIIGAPMVGVAGRRLAAAVCGAGGLGMIGVSPAADPASVEESAGELRSGGRPFGIGLLGWSVERRPELLEAALAARPALLSVSFGDWTTAVRRAEEAGVPMATQVGDREEARRAVGDGVDILVARGAEGGGHGRNTVATLPLLQVVLDAVAVPVVAAGGIATGRGLAAVLAAGAAGAWVGTALLACTESDNSPAAKERLIAARETDTVYTRAFDLAQRVPWPAEFGGRALRNRFTERWESREEELASGESAAEEIARARRRSDVDMLPIYAGQAVGVLDASRSATAVVRTMADAAEALLRVW